MLPHELKSINEDDQDALRQIQESMSILPPGAQANSEKTSHYYTDDARGSLRSRSVEPTAKMKGRFSGIPKPGGASGRVDTGSSYSPYPAMKTKMSSRTSNNLVAIKKKTYLKNVQIKKNQPNSIKQSYDLEQPPANALQYEANTYGTVSHENIKTDDKISDQVNNL